jgi:EAL domain-containing protein (putative c-di-GMP-specific phosphodiesterase class I)
MARWQRQGRYLPQLFVNAAAAQFTDDLPEAVARVLASHGLPPARLTLEITESQLPVLEANRPMRHLRESGVQIAHDDFGTGYSSLAQLARMGPAGCCGESAWSAAVPMVAAPAQTAPPTGRRPLVGGLLGPGR